MDQVDLRDWQVRPARADDLDALLGLAALTGGGFTNLPESRDALARRLAWSSESFGKEIAAPDDELYMLVLEHRPTGRVGGTACLFSRVGVRWPFYSYKLATLSMHSRELGRTFRTGVLHLVNDYDGASEVGGLFLHPDLRAGGLGRLLARSRYLFLRLCRARFGERVIAELRGRIRADGSSPFWDGLAGRFFGMPFVEADRFNAEHGNQFIADLMPRYPVYVALLPDDAREALGQPHEDGRGAMVLLAREGFRHEACVDIFDGGPTMEARIDELVAVRTAADDRVSPHTAPAGVPVRLVAAGPCAAFRAAALSAQPGADGLMLPSGHPFSPGEAIVHVPF